MVPEKLIRKVRHYTLTANLEENQLKIQLLTLEGEAHRCVGRFTPDNLPRDVIRIFSDLENIFMEMTDCNIDFDEERRTLKMEGLVKRRVGEVRQWCEFPLETIILDERHLIEILKNKMDKAQESLKRVEDMFQLEREKNKKLAEKQIQQEQLIQLQGQRIHDLEEECKMSDRKMKEQQRMIEKLEINTVTLKKVEAQMEQTLFAKACSKTIQNTLQNLPSELAMLKEEVTYLKICIKVIEAQISVQSFLPQMQLISQCRVSHPQKQKQL